MQFFGEINPKVVVDVLSALLTPTIAIVTAYIAVQQYRVNKTRLDLDLYDRRLSIFKAVEEFFHESFINGSITVPMVGKLRTATAEARFLFPKEIEVFLDTLSRKGTRAGNLRSRLYEPSGVPRMPVGDDRNKVVEEKGNLLNDIQGPLWEESKNLFRKYLTLA